MKQNSREDRVIKAVDTIEGQSDGLIHLSSGIVLKPKRVPNLMFAEMMRHFKRPNPPIVYNEDIGRNEENPNDPGYLEKLAGYNAEVTMAIVDLMVVSGTEVHSVPKSKDKPEDSGWREEMETVFESVGIKVENLVGKKLYLMWVKFYAAPSEDDISKIMEGVGRLSGVAESDVAEATARFRDNS